MYRGIVGKRATTPWGDRIRRRREQLGLTQLQLAQAIADRRPIEDGFTDQSVANIETGITRNPRVVTMRDIAQVLEVSLDYLMNGKDFIQQPVETLDDLKLRIVEMIDQMAAKPQPSPKPDRLGELADSVNAEAAAEAARRRSSAASAAGRSPRSHRPAADTAS